MLDCCQDHVISVHDSYASIVLCNLDIAIAKLHWNMTNIQNNTMYWYTNLHLVHKIYSGKGHHTEFCSDTMTVSGEYIYIYIYIFIYYKPLHLPTSYPIHRSLDNLGFWICSRPLCEELSREYGQIVFFPFTPFGPHFILDSIVKHNRNNSKGKRYPCTNHKWIWISSGITLCYRFYEYRDMKFWCPWLGILTAEIIYSCKRCKFVGVVLH